MNANPVLGWRSVNFGTAAYSQVSGILNPRVLRLGAQLKLVGGAHTGRASTQSLTGAVQAGPARRPSAVRTPQHRGPLVLPERGHRIDRRGLPRRQPARHAPPRRRSSAGTATNARTSVAAPNTPGVDDPHDQPARRRARRHDARGSRSPARRRRAGRWRRAPAARRSRSAAPTRRRRPRRGCRSAASTSSSGPSTRKSRAGMRLSSRLFSTCSSSVRRLKTGDAGSSAADRRPHRAAERRLGARAGPHVQLATPRRAIAIGEVHRRRRRLAEGVGERCRDHAADRVACDRPASSRRPMTAPSGR